MVCGEALFWGFSGFTFFFIFLWSSFGGLLDCGGALQFG